MRAHTHACIGQKVAAHIQLPFDAKIKFVAKTERPSACGVYYYIFALARLLFFPHIWCWQGVGVFGMMTTWHLFLVLIPAQSRIWCWQINVSRAAWGRRLSVVGRRKSQFSLHQPFWCQINVLPRNCGWLCTHSTKQTLTNCFYIASTKTQLKCCACNKLKILLQLWGWHFAMIKGLIYYLFLFVQELRSEIYSYKWMINESGGV